MSTETGSHSPAMSQKGSAILWPDPRFGAKLHSRSYSGKSYFIAAAFIFLAPVVTLGVIVATGEQVPTVKPYTLGDKVEIVAIVAGIAGAAAAMLGYKGTRERGVAVEVYEHGIRFVSAPGKESASLFSDLKEVKKQVFRGALARMIFVLADGQVQTVNVHSSKDAKMLQDVLSRLGSMRWEQDTGFRIM